MRDLQLDFQPRRPGPLALLALLAAALVCLDAGIEWRAAGLRLNEVSARVAEAEKRLNRQSGQANERFAALPPEQSKALSQASAAIAFDWEAIYRSIDRATGEDIALLAIVPDMAGKSLQISGEARDLKSLLAFVEALPQAPLTRASLASQKIKQDDPQHPVLFDIVAYWRFSS